MPSSPDPTLIPPSSAASGDGGRHRSRWIAAVLAVVALAVVGIVVMTRGSGSGADPAAALGPHPAVRIVDGQLVTRAGRPVRLLGVDVTGTESACIAGRQVAGATLRRRRGGSDPQLAHRRGPGAAQRGLLAGHQRRHRAVIGRRIPDADRALGASAASCRDRHDPRSALGRPWRLRRRPSVADGRRRPLARVLVAGRRDVRLVAGVVFDLYNEPTLGDPSPTSVSWGCWLRGCDTTASFSVIRRPGLGPLPHRRDAAIAERGARRGCPSAGPHRRPELRQRPMYPVGRSDRRLQVHGIGIVADRSRPSARTQLARVQLDRCRTSACWGSIHHLTAAARIPLVTTELGEDDCRDDFMRTYMNWADTNQVSYLAWTWTVNLHRVCVPGCRPGR